MCERFERQKTVVSRQCSVFRMCGPLKKTHQSLCDTFSRKKALKPFRQATLATFPFRYGKKHCKVDFARQILRKVKFYIITYNFVSQNAMKLHFTKSLDPTFSKVSQGFGVKPQGL